MTTADAIRRHTIAERSELVESMKPFDEAAGRLPTPCTGWTVRDLLAHLVGWDAMLLHAGRMGIAGVGLRWSAAMAGAAFDPDSLNGKLVVSDVDSGPDLLERFERQVPNTPHWLFERVAPGAQLAEYVIHHHDLSVATAVPHVPLPERIRIALDGVKRVPGLRARHVLAGNRLAATDVGWGAGRGPTMEASGEEVLLALAGRGPLRG